MITPAYVRMMAAYNTEMNRRLYAAAANLSDAQRKRDQGAFWGSIHRTLAHLYWGDASGCRDSMAGSARPCHCGRAAP